MNVELPVIGASVRQRVMLFAKLVGILVLIGVLLIPLAMIGGVLRERRGYQAQATEEIARLWGREQLVTGPVLAIPYVYRAAVRRPASPQDVANGMAGSELLSATAYFLPEVLNVNGAAEPERRHRGIYETVVYVAKLELEGFFQPDFAAAGIEAERIDWAAARVLLGVTDVHGVRAVGPQQRNGRDGEAFDSASDTLLPLAAKAPGVIAGEKHAFRFAVAVQGSGRLQIAPAGGKTAAMLRADWPDPSFVGAALPVTRRVSDEGFVAEWQSARFSRGFAQSWSDRFVANADALDRLAAAGFGVSFAQPIDGYGMVERARKYGVLFLVLVFAVFFLFEVTARLRIHPLQYALVGAGLCLFFLTFLALSEFWPVGLAYAVAAAACTTLVSLYARSFLQAGRRTLALAGALAATYGYLYFVLQSQDYALLAGTAALFVALALLMFCTRRIDWYAVDLGAAKREPEGDRNPT